MPVKHKNPEYGDRVAVAPYNFVPLPEKVLSVPPPSPQDRFEGYSGYFECELETCTPLYVRGMITPEEMEKGVEAKDKPAHYSVDGGKTPAIPGSTLRGLLRTLVEVISYSRPSYVTSKPLFFRTLDDSSLGKTYSSRMTGGDRSGDGSFPLAQAGYMEMEKGDYFIRPAQNIHGTQFYRVDEDLARRVFSNLETMAFQNRERKWSPNKRYHWLRKEIWFRPTKPTSHKPKSATYYAEVTEILPINQTPIGEDWVKGWFIASGWVPSRGGGRGKCRHWIVGPANPDDSQLIQIGDDDIALYRERGGGISQKIEREKFSVLPVNSKESIPCFYTFWEDESSDKRIAFGHTPMFRLPYLKSPARLLPPELKSREEYDMAEALFGVVDNLHNKPRVLAGRVFLSDAICLLDKQDIYMEEVVLSTQALSSPKPTAFQHYLTQDDPDYRDSLNHYDQTYSTTTLRGNKFYWHRGGPDTVARHLNNAPKPRQDIQGVENQDDRNVLKPVKPGVRFTFQIRYENLKSLELGALITVLDLVSHEKLRLKIGMGKPYGLGSAKLTVNKRILWDIDKRYSKLFNITEGSTNWEDSEYKDSYKIQDEAAKVFKTWILSDNGINSGPNKVLTFEDLPRIKQLLAMLRWPGPNPELTRYMSLGEFKNRPVLPDPERVGKPVIAGQPPKRRQSHKTPITNNRDFHNETRTGKSSASSTKDENLKEKNLPEIRENIDPLAIEIEGQLKHKLTNGPFTKSSLRAEKKGKKKKKKRK